MLWHDYIAINVESVATPDSLQGRLEDSEAFVGGKQPTAVVTAESDEMTLTTLVKTRQTPRHEDNLACQPGPVCDV